MPNLDLLAEINKADKGKILDTIRDYPDQIRHAWQEVSAIGLPSSYLETKRVIICGMGGSALGGRVVDALYSGIIRGPIEVFTDYHIPDYASSDTLVILSSYSGNTEETVNSFREAVSKKVSVFGLTTGGELKTLLEEKDIPRYVFTPKYNPSGQPRMSLGYSIAALLAILNKCGFITISESEVEKVIGLGRKYISEYDSFVPSEKNPAKALARDFFNKIPILVSSEHLNGIIHAFKNQVNENAKAMAVNFDIPELNHHLMEGLKNPAKSRELFRFLFFESDLYHEDVLKRYALTAEVVEKNGYPFSIYPLRAPTRVEQVFEVLILGSFISFYLSFLYGEDASKIPWVDYFKEKL